MIKSLGSVSRLAMYNLQSSTVTSNPVGSAGSYTDNHLMKALTDFSIFSDAYRAGSSLMSYSQWTQQPIFVFKTRSTPNNTSNNCYVTVNGSVAAANSNMVLG